MTPSAPLVVFPDQLRWEAGHEYGLVALAGLRHLPWRAVVALDGPYLEAVGYAVRQLGLGERVDFVADVRASVDRAGLLLAPRLAELDNALLLRALGRHLPVITSEPSIAFSDAYLRRVPARDPGALAAALAVALPLPAPHSAGSPARRANG